MSVRTVRDVKGRWRMGRRVLRDRGAGRSGPAAPLRVRRRPRRRCRPRGGRPRGRGRRPHRPLPPRQAGRGGPARRRPAPAERPHRAGCGPPGQGLPPLRRRGRGLAARARIRPRGPGVRRRGRALAGRGAAARDRWPRRPGRPAAATARRTTGSGGELDRSAGCPGRPRLRADPRRRRTGAAQLPVRRAGPGAHRAWCAASTATTSAACSTGSAATTRRRGSTPGADRCCVRVEESARRAG